MLYFCFGVFETVALHVEHLLILMMPQVLPIAHIGMVNCRKNWYFVIFIFGQFDINLIWIRIDWKGFLSYKRGPLLEDVAIRYIKIEFELFGEVLKSL